MSESIEGNATNSSIVQKTSSEGNKRGKWGQKIEFILTTLSFVVGFGNVWRFPYICYRNGGGVFLIPYFVCVLFLGLPVLLMEMTLGQYSAHGTITVWKFMPIFQGIGVAMFVMVTILSIYYNTLLAWVIYYFFASFTLSDLPWKHCNNEWNTKDCSETKTNRSKSKTPADEYFHNEVLRITDSMNDIFELNTKTALCLFIAWFLIFLSLSRGIKSMGKVSYLTAIFPYVCLTILLCYGLTLDGSFDGIKYLIAPDFSKLISPKIWIDAGEQIFYSLGLAWGTVITLSSYNHFDNHVIRDAFIIALGNSFTSIFAACVVFSYMGSMAYELGIPIENVTSKGAGLAFIMYPQAVARFPSGQIWSIIFFFMMILLGLGSMNSTLESLLTAVFDLRPDKRKFKLYIVALMCAVMFCCGLIFCTNSGMYYFQLVDSYCATTSALIIGLTEVLAVFWVYGIDKYMNHIKEMIGSYPTPNIYWKVIWKFICPLIIGILLMISFAYKKDLTYNDFNYPFWTTLLGWFLTLCSVAAIPIVSIYYLHQYWSGKYSNFKDIINPDIDWKTKH